MKLTVRPLVATDFDGFINYWLGLSPAEIERMGVAIDRMPSATRMRSDLERMLTVRNRDVRMFVLAWWCRRKHDGHISRRGRWLHRLVRQSFGTSQYTLEACRQ